MIQSGHCIVDPFIVFIQESGEQFNVLPTLLLELRKRDFIIHLPKTNMFVLFPVFRYGLCYQQT
jgi:hypothetical protein